MYVAFAKNLHYEQFLNKSLLSVKCLWVNIVTNIDINRDLLRLIKTAFFLIIFGNRKRWNRGIVNGMQQFLGIGRTGRVFHLFRLFHLRKWDSWNSGDRFRWTLDFYSGTE